MIHRPMSRGVWEAALLLGACVASAAAQSGGAFAPSTVRAAPAEREPVQELRTVVGELRAFRTSRVATQDAGLVRAVLVREGDRVDAGQLLVELDAVRLRLQRDQLLAERALAEAERMEREAEVARAQRDVELISTAYEGRAANARELLDAHSALEVAQARLTQSQRRIEAIAAQVALVDRRLADAQITAPFAGVVVLRRVEQGEWVQPGEPLVELVDLEQLEAWVSVPQEFYPFVQQHRGPIPVYVEALRQTRAAEQWRAVPRVEAGARTFTLIARLENRDGRLAPGLTLAAWVPTGAVSKQIVVPRDAVLTSDTGPFVYVVRGGDPGPPHVEYVPVQMLFPVDARVAVRSPQLAPGDLVVVEGNERLFPSAPVTVVPRDDDEPVPPAPEPGT